MSISTSLNINFVEVFLIRITKPSNLCRKVLMMQNLQPGLSENPFLRIVKFY